MKKLIKEEVASRGNYSASAGIRVGESHGIKTTFKSEVLDSSKKPTNEVQSTMEDVWNVIGWECPIDRASVDALCQLQEVYVEEK
jgi:hypothetical protein